MKLSISNIGWSPEKDAVVYGLMKKYGYSGLEIAPTRIFPDAPYEKISEAKDFSKKLKKDYGFVIPSMQSIWFGRTEKLFGSQEEYRILMEHTKKAIDFAAAIRCKNLVFGCPRNRNLPDGAAPETAVPFFKELGDYAFAHGTVIGMEANPPIYNTNYINDTQAAIKLIKQVDSKGFLLNLDIGTMIQNGEDVSELTGNVALINHVHISEPGLNLIGEREIHKQVKDTLVHEGYGGFVSIEMGRVDKLSVIEEKMEYVRRIFHGI